MLKPKDTQPHATLNRNATVANTPTIKVHLSNIHPLVSANELEKIATDLLGKKILRAHIHYYGPKSTGEGFLLFDNGEDAVKLNQSINNYLIRGQPVFTYMPKKNREVRHIKQAKKKVQPPKVYDEEVSQIKEKFKESFKLLSDDPLTFSLSLIPSDPDFPYDLKSLQLQITIPQNYPAEACEFKVENEDLNETVKTQITTAIQQRSKAYLNKPMISGLLRFLDINLFRLLIDKKATQDFQLKQLGIEIIIPKKKLDPPLATSTESSKPEIKDDNSNNINHNTMNNGTSKEDSQRPLSEGESSKEGSRDSEDGSEGDDSIDSEDKEDKGNDGDGKEEKVGKSYPTRTAHRGTQVLADKLQIDGLGVLECVDLLLVMICARCRTRSEVELSDSKNFSESTQCPQCHQSQSIIFRKEILHIAARIIGYLDLEGCTPFDYLPSDFVGSCLECSASLRLNRLSFDPQSINCTTCHHKIVSSIEGIRFNKIRVSENTKKGQEARGEIQPRKKRDPKENSLKPGTPLPKEGACKHYKKSRRWLRFPCCNLLFPCDICHDESCDHPAQWAKRMMCGFCSKEQAYSNSAACKFCEGDVTGKLHRTRFWEGGAGCRNTRSMSNKDPHKYKNLNKTVSQKAARTGPHKK